MRTKQILLGVALSLFLVTTLPVSSASSYGSSFYNMSGGTTGGQGTITGAVGYTDWVKKSELNVGIYFKENKGSVTLMDYDYCPGKSKYDDGYGGGKLNSIVTEYRFTLMSGEKGSGLDDSGMTTGKKLASCRKDKTISFSKLKESSELPGWYRVELKVKPETNAPIWNSDKPSERRSSDIQNTFRLSANGKSAKIAPLGGASIKTGDAKKGFAVTLAQSSSSPSYQNYRIGFGSNCEVDSASKRVELALFDLDNVKGEAQGNGGLIKMSLVKQSHGGGAWKAVKLLVGPTGSKAHTNDGSPYEPETKNDEDYSVWFKPEKGMRYELRLDNVYSGNAIQYNTPFDGIYYDVSCPDPVKWRATPSTSMKVGSTNAYGTRSNPTDVAPGTTVNWSHSVTNTGDKTDKDIKVVIHRSYGSDLSTKTWTKGRRDKASITYKAPAYGNTSYKTTAAHAGQTLCQNVTINPKSSSGGNESSAERCVYVMPSWYIKPSLGDVSPAVSNPGQTLFNVAASVKATGNPDGTHTYGLAMFRLPPGGSPVIPLADGAYTPNTVCERIRTVYGLGPNNTDVCNTVIAYSSATFGNNETKSFLYSPKIPDNAALGTRYCFVSFVYDPTSASTDNSWWRYSAIKCTIVAKSPKVQIRSHDARVVGDIRTTYSEAGGKVYSSWAEYGILAGGCNWRGTMPSGAYSRGGSSVSFGSALSTGNLLTFSNKNQPTACEVTGVADAGNGFFEGDLGGIDTERVSISATKLSSLSAINLSSQFNSTAEDTLKISSGVRKLIYAPDNTVIIDKNIVYNGPFSSARDLPQIKIIAKNIIVKSNVTRIDAWVVADESLATCDLAGAIDSTQPNNPEMMSTAESSLPLSAGLCNQKIVFNGPVQAGMIYLYRTGGAMPGVDDAAEVFNMRADVYVANMSPIGSVATTDSVIDLPPRF